MSVDQNKDKTLLSKKSQLVSSSLALLEELFGSYKFAIVYLVVCCVLSSSTAFSAFLGLSLFVSGWLLRLCTLSWDEKDKEQAKSAKSAEYLFMLDESAVDASFSPRRYIRAPMHLANIGIGLSLAVLSGSFLVIFLAFFIVSLYHGHMFYKSERLGLFCDHENNLWKYQREVPAFFPRSSVNISKVFLIIPNVYLKVLSQEFWGMASLFFALALISIC